DPARMQERPGTWIPSSMGSTGLWVGDLHGDGRAEIVASNATSWVVLAWDPVAAAYRPRAFHESSSTILAMHVGDADGDGKPDVVLLEQSGHLEVFDPRTCALEGTVHTAVTSPTDMAVADMEGGPEVEIVVVNRDDLWVYRLGSPVPVWTFPGAGGTSIAIG